jgi:hypothetical protein
MFVQYQPQLPGLPHLKVTVVPDDSRILSRKEIQQVVEQFTRYRFLLVEVALDLYAESEIDLDFILRHALFGKSRRNQSRLFFRTAFYGARHSDKLIRCYRKENLNVFRVELELHSRLLRRYGITQIRDLRKLAAALCPRHLNFVRLDWAALGNYFLRSGFRRNEIFQRLRKKAASIHAAMDFLRAVVGVRNPHRFLKRIAPSTAVHHLLEAWARIF